MKGLKMSKAAVVVLASLSMVLVSGCGVSKRGKEMRTQAYSRMDEVNAGMLHEQATTAFETGQLDKAMNLADQAVVRYPKGTDHHVLRGRVLMELDRLAEANRSFKKAIDINEEHADAHYFSGIVYERLSRDELASDLFHKSSQLDPDKLQFLMASIESLIAQGQFDEAEKKLIERFDDFEHNASLHHLHGQLMVMQGRHDEASHSYEMASLLAPNDLHLLEEWVRVRHRLDDHAGSLAGIQELQTLHEQTLGKDMLLIKGRALSATGRDHDARSTYQDIALDHGDDMGVWEEFGLFAWELGDWRSLERCTNRLNAAGVDNLNARLFTAVCARESGDLQKASKVLSRTLEAHPDHPIANALLASVHMRRGENEEAEKAWKVAVKSAPKGSDGVQVTGVLGNGP
jgi:tetratricopeptide (TPR) repeat protein